MFCGTEAPSQRGWRRKTASPCVDAQHSTFLTSGCVASLSNSFWHKCPRVAGSIVPCRAPRRHADPQKAVAPLAAYSCCPQAPRGSTGATDCPMFCTPMFPPGTYISPRSRQKVLQQSVSHLHRHPTSLYATFHPNTGLVVYVGHS